VGLRVGQKVIDVSGAVGKVVFIDHDRKRVAVKIIDDLDGFTSMQQGGEYSIPEKQLKAWTEKEEEKIKKKRGWFRRKK
jgi:hypothetical protein